MVLSRYLPGVERQPEEIEFGVSTAQTITKNQHEVAWQAESEVRASAENDCSHLPKGEGKAQESRDCAMS